MTPEQAARNFLDVETATNDLKGVTLEQGHEAAQRLQVHALLAVGSALALVAEEIANLRVALTEK